MCQVGCHPARRVLPGLPKPITAPLQFVSAWLPLSVSLSLSQTQRESHGSPLVVSKVLQANRGGNLSHLFDPRKHRRKLKNIDILKTMVKNHSTKIEPSFAFRSKEQEPQTNQGQKPVLGVTWKIGAWSPSRSDTL